MPSIPARFQFEPNKDALKLWLATRKEEKHYGMKDAPGLFSTHAFGTDQFFFVLAFILELVGVGLLIANGFSLGDRQFAIIAIIGAIGMFLADLFLAFLLHRNHGRKCLGRNRLKITEDESSRVVIQKQLKAGRLGNGLIIIGMILIAVIKFLGIILLGTFDHLAIYISLFVMFSFIVYVHINHTGYFIYEWLTNRAIKNQYADFVEPDKSKVKASVKEAKIREFYFIGDTNLLDGDRKEIISNEHKIVGTNKKEGSAKGKYAYLLVTKGLLIDEDISGFLQTGMDKQQRTLIASACVDHQIDIYDNP